MAADLDAARQRVLDAVTVQGAPRMNVGGVAGPEEAAAISGKEGR
jgi:hypothetical protein